MSNKSSKELSVKNGQKKLSIAIRKPWHVPEDDYHIPAPSKMLQAPAQVNILQLILPPALMITLSIITSFLSNNRGVPISMFGMGVAYPLANLFVRSQAKKKYEKQVIEREQTYKAKLKQTKGEIDSLISQQKIELDKEYPDTANVLEIGLLKGNERRLWWRRRHDKDFLALRIGQRVAGPSFAIIPPRNSEQGDPLADLPQDLLSNYTRIPNIPFLLKMRRAGSVVIRANAVRQKYEFVYRMLLDMMVHHSPEDMEISVVSDRPDNATNWEWLKFSPHIKAVQTKFQSTSLFFQADKISDFIYSIKKIFDERMETARKYNDDNYAEKEKAMIIIFDDVGDVREKPDIAELAALGFSCGIYCIFVGERGTPNVCRARIDVTEDAQIRYLETWDAQNRHSETIGNAEFLSRDDSERISRSLSSLMVSGGAASQHLPSLVRLSEMLGSNALSVDRIVENWSTRTPANEQALFPLGFTIGQAGLENIYVDFRPEKRKGRGAYHAMLIGSTGSGKSILLQTMIMATAHKYSPKLMNFMFMDFKDGPSELGFIKALPHVVGMVSDLDQEAAERALQALSHEIKRRQQIFKSAVETSGKAIPDIFAYNEEHPDNLMPHLLVVIDEFGRGINLLPDLVDRLDVLGTQGRAFGVYFFLGNQSVSNKFEKLNKNVGWKIALRVEDKREMKLLGIDRPIPPGQGRGHMKVRSDTRTFQAGYAGAPIDTSNTGFMDYEIVKIGSDGTLSQVIYDNVSSMKEGNGNKSRTQSELDVLLEQIELATSELDLPKAKQIYLEPLPSEIPLKILMARAEKHRIYAGGRYSNVKNESRNLVASIGQLDLPEKRVQPVMELDLNVGKGSAWFMGPGGLGDTMALRSLMLSLAQTHTPEEVWFYVLDYGDGSMRALEPLPHTGAVIMEHEKERINRLFDFLKKTSRERRESKTRDNGSHHICLIINNYMSLREGDLDREKDVIDLMRTGNETGIHVIITSDRDLSQRVKGNITTRVGLQANDKDEYYPVVGKVSSMPRRADGRGFIKLESGIVECQIATHPAEDELSALMDEMDAHWDGGRPVAIVELSDKIPYPDGEMKMDRDEYEEDALVLPLGVSFNNPTNYASVDLLDGHQYWMVAGPARSGKTNLLFALAAGALKLNPGKIKPVYMTLKPGKIDRLKGKVGFDILNSPDEIIDFMETLPTENTGIAYLLLLDDLNSLYDPSQLDVGKALNKLNEQRYEYKHVYIVGAGMKEKIGSARISPLLKEYRTGIALSLDTTDHSHAGMASPLPMSVKKTIKFPMGRAFLIINGEYQIIQIPNTDDGKWLLTKID